MGTEITNTDFKPADYERFQGQLSDDLTVLKSLLRRDGFGEGPTSIGAELEFSIIDETGAPTPLGPRLKDEAQDPRLQLEIDQFNLELNLDPIGARGEPFSAMAVDINKSIQALDEGARKHQARLISIGILPSLREEHLGSHSITNSPRYRALSENLKKQRQGNFEIHIDGKDPLDLSVDDVTREGAATSLQLHLRVSPKEYAKVFNATQLATSVVLAVAGNSPFFVGHDLWDETRIALFKQSVDSRERSSKHWHYASRVNFGKGWVREGAYELFAENASLFPVLLPISLDTDHGSEPPALQALRLHQGTIWNWNRAIYDPADDGHLRIEMRALPSGPTPIDMLANSAFLIGLSIGLGDQLEDLLPAFPFTYAEYNFYRAAKHGLDAKLLWPTTTGLSPQEFSAPELASQLLPIAQRGLESIGISTRESASFLQIIQDRIDAQMTGARWQRILFSKLTERTSRKEAFLLLVNRYQEEAATQKPVSAWNIEI